MSSVSLMSQKYLLKLSNDQMKKLHCTHGEMQEGLGFSDLRNSSVSFEYLNGPALEQKLMKLVLFHRPNYQRSVAECHLSLKRDGSSSFGGQFLLLLLDNLLLK